MPKTTPSKADVHNRLKDETRYVQHRRRLLKSLAVSGAAITAKAIPEKWSQPILDTTMLPAHAQSTCVVESLTCELGSITGVTDSAIFDPNLPVPGGTTVDVQPTRDPTDPATITISALTATVEPSCAEPVTLLATSDFGGNDFDLESGTNQTVVPIGGVASFSPITAVADSDFGGPTDAGLAPVDLTFSTTSTPDCVIDIQFREPDT